MLNRELREDELKVMSLKESSGMFSESQVSGEFHLESAGMLALLKSHKQMKMQNVERHGIK